MKAVCLYNDDLDFFLTTGKVYDVEESKFNHNHYLVVDNTGRTNAYDRLWFWLIKGERTLFELYFVKDDSEFIYGKGSKEYVVELMNDWIATHEMYGYDEVHFKVVKRTLEYKSGFKEELDDWR